jgi:hypothetical protein
LYLYQSIHEELKMIYAHIYKAPKALGKYKLIVTTGFGISEGVISESFHADMRSAKAAAAAVGAKAWNY